MAVLDNARRSARYSAFQEFFERFAHGGYPLLAAAAAALVWANLAPETYHHMKNSILLNPSHLNAVQAIDLACREVETPLQRLEHDLENAKFAIILASVVAATVGYALLSTGTAEPAQTSPDP